MYPIYWIYINSLLIDKIYQWTREEFGEKLIGQAALASKKTFLRKLRRKVRLHSMNLVTNLIRRTRHTHLLLEFLKDGGELLWITVFDKKKLRNGKVKAQQLSFLPY